MAGARSRFGRRRRRERGEVGVQQRVHEVFVEVGPADEHVVDAERVHRLRLVRIGAGGISVRFKCGYCVRMSSTTGPSMAMRRAPALLR